MPAFAAKLIVKDVFFAAPALDFALPRRLKLKTIRLFLMIRNALAAVNVLLFAPKKRLEPAGEKAEFAKKKPLFMP